MPTIFDSQKFSWEEIYSTSLCVLDTYARNYQITPELEKRYDTSASEGLTEIIYCYYKADNWFHNVTQGSTCRSYRTCAVMRAISSILSSSPAAIESCWLTLRAASWRRTKSYYDPRMNWGQIFHARMLPRWCWPSKASTHRQLNSLTVYWLPLTQSHCSTPVHRYSGGLQQTIGPMGYILPLISTLTLVSSSVNPIVPCIHY